MLGASIHDVAQVAGAGLSISPEVGAQAVIIKMIRVACLLPVVASFSLFFFRLRSTAHNAEPVAPVPGFILAFLLLAISSSIGLLPDAARSYGGQISGCILTASVAAIGLSTSFGDLKRADHSLVAVLIGQSALQLLAVLTLIHYLF